MEAARSSMCGFITELPWEAAMGSDAGLGVGLGGLGAGYGIGGSIGRGGGTSECGVN